LRRTERGGVRLDGSEQLLARRAARRLEQETQQPVAGLRAARVTGGTGDARLLQQLRAEERQLTGIRERRARGHEHVEHVAAADEARDALGLAPELVLFRQEPLRIVVDLHVRPEGEPTERDQQCTGADRERASRQPVGDAAAEQLRQRAVALDERGRHVAREATEHDRRERGGERVGQRDTQRSEHAEVDHGRDRAERERQEADDGRQRCEQRGASQLEHRLLGRSARLESRAQAIEVGLDPVHTPRRRRRSGAPAAA
jgi:hypothetical protein